MLTDLRVLWKLFNYKPFYDDYKPSPINNFIQNILINMIKQKRFVKIFYTINRKMFIFSSMTHYSNRHGLVFRKRDRLIRIHAVFMAEK